MTTMHTNPATRPTVALASRRAFSLLELTLVLLIIGLLSAVAAVNFASAGDRAKIKTTKVTMSNYKTAIRLYTMDKGAAPATIGDLITGKFLEPDNKGNAPTDAWQRPLYYQLTPGAAHEFDLISAGKDGEFETDDDINLWAPDFDE